MFKRIFIIFCGLFGLFGCEDIIETDLGEKYPLLISPTNEQVIHTNSIKLKWDAMKGATNYQLQIVSPCFDSIANYVTDTILTGTYFCQILALGKYQWRVRSLNSSSYSLYSTYSFSIDSTGTLSNEIIQLIAPVDNDTTFKTSYIFNWTKLPAAQNYHFLIYFEGSMIVSQIIDSPPFAYKLNTGNGEYEWKLRAQNAFSNSNYFSHLLYIDTIVPGTPVLQSPQENAILNDSVIHFSWMHFQEGGSSICDSLIICKDSLMTNISREIKIFTTTYIDTFDPGSYFWCIRSIDKAGNLSSFSSKRKFVVAR